MTTDVIRSVKLPADVWDDLTAIATTEDRSTASLIRHILRVYTRDHRPSGPATGSPHS